MTLFAFIKQCLRQEAVRTEPDCTSLLQRVLNPSDGNRTKKNTRPEEKAFSRPPKK